MGGSYSMYRGEEGFWWGNLRYRNRLEDLGVGKGKGNAHLITGHESPEGE
jgi:hypothetical protein